MRNHPDRTAAMYRPSDGVVLHFNKRDAEIVRNWSKTALSKDWPEREN